MQRLNKTIDMLKMHAKHEERFVHPPLEAKLPGITKSYGQDHQTDEKAYDQLQQLTGRIPAAGPEQGQLGKEMYSLFNRFISEYLGHMEREETELEAALIDNFTDEDLGAIEQQIMSSVPPEQMVEMLPFIFSSLNADELIGMLGGMKASAPPPVVEGVMKMAEQAMPAATWQKVRSRIA